MQNMHFLESNHLQYVSQSLTTDKVNITKPSKHAYFWIYFAFNNQAGCLFVVVRQSRFLLFRISVFTANPFPVMKTGNPCVHISTLLLLQGSCSYYRESCYHCRNLVLFSLQEFLNKFNLFSSCCGGA